jgi:hypothetical protein
MHPGFAFITLVVLDVLTVVFFGVFLTDVDFVIFLVVALAGFFTVVFSFC